MANGHGGARPGAGRKKKALSEKIIDGNPGKAPLTKLQFGLKETDMHGEDMPPVSEYLKQVTKNSQQNLAPQIYEDTWRWLNERGCAIYVKKELIEQYALYMQRWIQCEEGINQFPISSSVTKDVLSRWRQRSEEISRPVCRQQPSTRSDAQAASPVSSDRWMKSKKY